MLFSSKISNSVLSYLETVGHGVEALYAGLEIPEEFLRDPSSWVEAPKMEQFLATAERQFGKDQNLLELVGHNCAELFSWGVLDSVLRMVEKPQDMYLQPGRFLSYFIMPQPHLVSVKKGNSHISFEIPILPEDFPHVTKYLQAAFEALPSYLGREHATVNWKGHQISVTWDESQSILFSESANIKPELFHGLIDDLETKQKELEQKNRELLEKNKELEEAQKQLEQTFKEKVFTEKLTGLSELASSVAHEVNNPLAYVTSNVSRLNDYMVRAQQLVTIFVGQDRATPQVKEAMRRMDWAFIQKDFPQIVSEVNFGLQKVRDIVKDLSYLTGKTPTEDKKVNVSLSELIENTIKMVESDKPGFVDIERNFFFSGSVPVYPIRLEQALVNILKNAMQSIETSGVVRVVTRPKGTRAEIEVTDTGKGMDKKTLDSIFKPFYTTKKAGKGSGLGLSISHSIIEMHQGDIKVFSEPGVGSSFILELPLEHNLINQKEALHV